VTRDDAINVARRYAQRNSHEIGEVENATFVPALPPISSDDQWSVVFEDKMIPGNAIVITVDPKTKTATVFVP
jgi:hypothetical protein